MSEKVKTRVAQKKEIFLEALKRNLNVITAACEQTGFGRQTFYNWCDKDPEFRRRVDELNDIQFDFVETQLLKKIKEGSEASIIFYMKTKGKKKGYGDNLDITTNGGAITEIKLTRVENGNT
jgi:hypothetical protein